MTFDPISSGEARRTRVCFYRRHATGIFCSSPSQPAAPFGGAEFRARNFAVALAALPEFEVLFAIDASEHLPQSAQAVSLVGLPPLPESLPEFAFRRFMEQGGRRTPTFPWFSVPRWHWGLAWQLPLIASQHLIWNRLPARWRTPRPQRNASLAAIDADVVCCFGGNHGAADVVATCRATGKKAIVFSINVQEVDAERLSQPRVPDLGEWSALIRYVFERADAIVVQTDEQQRAIARSYHRQATVIRNPIDTRLSQPLLPADQRRYVFWVGRAEPPGADAKRAALCVELARRCAPIPFEAVINPTHPALFRELLKSAPANLRIHEQIAPHAIEAYFREAALLLNTSSNEGFPNAWLQAAKYATPVVSLAVDPDQVVARHRFGVVCGDDLDRAAAEITRLWHASAERDALGAAARTYVQEIHEVTACVSRLAGVIKGLCGGASKRE